MSGTVCMFVELESHRQVRILPFKLLEWKF